jgi:salicylate hydroxylase
LKALIAGGGIGGLTTALCLINAGIEVELLEQAAAFAEVGAGLQISPNGMHVLKALDLDTTLASCAFEPERIEMRLGQSGRQIFTVPLKDVAVARYGAPYLHLHRADLLEVLVRALIARAPQSMRMSAKVTDYRLDGTGVVARLANGSEVAGDILIGADGIHSAVRAQMLGPDAPRFTGNVAWRLVVPADGLRDLVPPSACIWAGPGRHAVTYYLRRGELVNFVGVVEQTSWQQESWTAEGDKTELAADFAGWHDTLQQIIARAGACHRRALFDRAPLDRWSDGPVTLLGDACHPMLPFLAQGAVMAIEDAWVLSRCLAAQPQDPALALQRYASLRQPRTARVQLGARANAKNFHVRSKAGQLAKYGALWLGARVLPSVIHARQDWIYGYDVTAASLDGPAATDQISPENN